MAKHAASDTQGTKKRSSRGSASSMKVKRDTVDAPRPKKKTNARQVMVTVVVVFFAILMVASVLMPSLAQVVSSNAQRQAAEEEYAAALAAQGSASGSDASGEYDFSTVSGILDAYAELISSAEKKLADDPEDLAHLYNAGQVYMNAALNAAQVASEDEDSEDTATLLSYFQTAEGYFDQYLAIKETDAVKVSRALCELYQANVEEAVTELRAITAASPDYAPAWLNLGRIYEIVGMNSSAIAAYAKAQETDPKNDYGARMYATNRITELQSQLTQEELSYDTDSTSEVENNGVLQLWQDLASHTSSVQTDGLADEAPAEETSE